MNTLGAALVAVRWRGSRSAGRPVSLTTGALVAILGAAVVVVASTLNVLPALLVGMGLLGAHCPEPAVPLRGHEERPPRAPGAGPLPGGVVHHRGSRGGPTFCRSGKAIAALGLPPFRAGS
ncbi:hypothetical protein QJS66_12080 [Kocuria rhizophila]|nr:hypothetical protein QJS66_12080 [Kocuria rhizophila]